MAAQKYFSFCSPMLSFNKQTNKKGARRGRKPFKGRLLSEGHLSKKRKNEPGFTVGMIRLLWPIVMTGSTKKTIPVAGWLWNKGKSGLSCRSGNKADG
ncbi:hypothetical protein B0I18_11136 [Taibaiella chishuiensis]|uniref:Uncharacterized protein n=1 Tax=Taibaiella chishuiensis TaxID=1434707 RepID=A0A2P8CWX9_9BACT|nr:hypothetical protein B0I18_11136 [Taibaiella chishuiensis]